MCFPRIALLSNLSLRLNKGVEPLIDGFLQFIEFFWRYSIFKPISNDNQRHMKKIHLYFLIGFFLLASQLNGQVVTIPLAEGNNGGGTILSYDVATGKVNVIPNQGNIGFGVISQGLPPERESTELGGMTYHQPSGNIYISLYNQQLSPISLDGLGVIMKYNVYTKELKQVYRFSESRNNGLRHPINELTLHNDGMLYGVVTIGGAHNGGGVFHIDPSDDSFHIDYEFDQSKEGYSPTIIKSLGGKLYTSTRWRPGNLKGYALYEFNSSQKQIIELALYNSSSENYRIYDMVLNRGYLWLASNTNIDRYNLSTGEFHPYVPAYIRNAGWRARGFLNSSDSRFYTIFEKGGSGDVGTIAEVHPT